MSTTHAMIALAADTGSTWQDPSRLAAADHRPNRVGHHLLDHRRPGDHRAPHPEEAEEGRRRAAAVRRRPAARLPALPDPGDGAHDAGQRLRGRWAAGDLPELLHGVPALKPHQAEAEPKMIRIAWNQTCSLSRSTTTRTPGQDRAAARPGRRSILSIGAKAFQTIDVNAAAMWPDSPRIIKAGLAIQNDLYGLGEHDKDTRPQYRIILDSDLLPPGAVLPELPEQ